MSKHYAAILRVVVHDNYVCWMQLLHLEIYSSHLPTKYSTIFALWFNCYRVIILMNE